MLYQCQATRDELEVTSQTNQHDLDDTYRYTCLDCTAKVPIRYAPATTVVCELHGIHGLAADVAVAQQCGEAMRQPREIVGVAGDAHLAVLTWRFGVTSLRWKQQTAHNRPTHAHTIQSWCHR